MSNLGPALTAEEWAALRKDAQHRKAWAAGILARGGPLQIIALCNDELPDSAPRKITREKIARLRDAIVEADANEVEPHRWDDLSAFADALEAYLPPPNFPK